MAPRCSSTRPSGSLCRSTTASPRRSGPVPCRRKSTGAREPMRTIAITGSASGMGARLRERLVDSGDRVIGVDLRNAAVEAGLGTPAGRAQAIERVTELSGGALDGLVTLAGLAGLPERPASLLISGNYYGTVELLPGRRPRLAQGPDPAPVAISSNSTTCQPGLDEDLIASCLA